MRKLLIRLGLLIIFIAPLSMGVVASAQYDPFSEDCFNQGTTTEGCDPCQEAPDSEVCQAAKDKDNPISGPTGVLVTVLGILSWIVGVASVLMIIFGGFKYILSNGDANAIAGAKTTVIYAVIGAVVFAFSQLIIRFVISRL